jgi:hypothetical protein
MARKQALAQARGGIRALGPLALASLKAQRCALKRIQSRERRPSIAKATAGVSGQCRGIPSSEGGSLERSNRSLSRACGPLRSRL